MGGEAEDGKGGYGRVANVQFTVTVTREPAAWLQKSRSLSASLSLMLPTTTIKWFQINPLLNHSLCLSISPAWRCRNEPYGHGLDPNRSGLRVGRYMGIIRWQSNHQFCRLIALDLELVFLFVFLLFLPPPPDAEAERQAR